MKRGDFHALAGHGLIGQNLWDALSHWKRYQKFCASWDLLFQHILRAYKICSINCTFLAC